MGFARLLAGLQLAAACCVLVADDGALKLFKKGEQAEKAHKMARAYLLYSEAAAQDPYNAKYWLRAQSVRVQAILESPPKIRTKAAPGTEQLKPLPPGESSISKKDLEEARKPQAPFELRGRSGRQTFQLKGDFKALYEKVAKAFGLDVVFDGDYQAGQPIKLTIEDADCRDALLQLNAATDSFLIPISTKVFLVAKDVPQKRTELEPHVAVVVPIPDPVSLQEAQELAMAVRQIMEINKFQFDGAQRLALFRDRISKVRPAEALYEQLLHPRPDVMVEVDFVEVDRSASWSAGLNLPQTVPFVAVGDIPNYTPAIPPGYDRIYTFFGGKSLVGLGVMPAQLMATMSRGFSRTLLKARIRAADGQPATFHAGDRYPVMTAGYFGDTSSAAGTIYAPPPSFNFEDLGLSIKLTPQVHGSDEVSLDIEAEFKVLGGQSLNGIPVISNRKIQSRIRLRSNEWGIVAGLMSSNDARTIAGLAGLAQVPLLGPLLRSNTSDTSNTDVLVVLKPQILGIAPSDYATRAIWTGSEGRPLTGL
ncbi:MAG: type II and III secretion system protein [Bryobacterales bacterium]|nr:type II and III secretion system protein [Bryobacterales bacterium]